MCQAGQSLNGSGYSASVWVYLDADVAATALPLVGIGLSTGSASGIGGTNIAANAWTRITASLSGSQGPNLVVFYTAGAMTGTLYIDDVTLTGP